MSHLCSMRRPLTHVIAADAQPKGPLPGTPQFRVRDVLVAGGGHGLHCPVTTAIGPLPRRMTGRLCSPPSTPTSGHLRSWRYEFKKVVVLHLISLSLLLAHAGAGCCFRTFRVRNRVLRLIPNKVVNSLTGSPC